MSYGSIPAWAGETLWAYRARSATRVYPRVGGGNSNDGGVFGFAPGLSPRGRGKLAPHRSRERLGRSIPAWAGETIHPLARQ